MSVRTMRTWLAPVALLLLVACGGPEDLGATARGRLDAAVKSAEDAAAVARSASEQVAELEDRLEEMRAELGRATRWRTRAADRLARLRERLWASLQDIRGGLGDVRSAAGASAAQAQDALGRASDVARDLAVLEQRYDSHLRRYHGGG